MIQLFGCENDLLHIREDNFYARYWYFIDEGIDVVAWDQLTGMQ